MPVGHALDVHDFLVIGAVVVHHRQQRNPVMRRGPQDAGRVHQIAVGLDADDEASVLLVRERRADGRRSAVADACAARRADVLIRLVERPQPHRPPAHEVDRRHERPVAVLDLRPQLGRQPRGADRARVPGIRGFGARALEQALPRLGQLAAALLECSLPVRRDAALHRLDERRQRRFGVGGHRDIDFRIALQVLIVRLAEQIAGRDADESWRRPS